MALKDLMVHLDQGERSIDRLTLAIALARRHGARLIGVFAQKAPVQRLGLASSWPSAEFTQACEASKAQFEKATLDLPQSEWRLIKRAGEAEILRQFIDQARHTDLVVLGQHERGRDFAPEDLVGDVVFGCGRPVLIVPYIGSFPEVGRTPLIAWNNAPEAARALNDALPLMDGCQMAHVLSVCARQDEGVTSCTEVERHLATHGIKARAEVVLVEDFGIMDVMLNRASERGADLLVMGAHGSIGFPFESRGAGTRYILGHMTVPVLMSS